LSTLPDRIQIESFLDESNFRTVEDDTLDGLTRPFKEIPPRYLYDAHGSDLFEQITELPEYYQTRTERQILTDHAGDIIALTGAGELVELGSGSAVKTRLLLDAMRDAKTLHRYLPFDIAEHVVRESAATLSSAYPELQIHGIVGDFDQHLHSIPPATPDQPRIIAFLGGTIGNFSPGTRRHFLRSIGSLLNENGFFLLGVDLVKDPAVIERAYNDAAGVTAQFNLNILNVLNRELAANFPVDQFEHVAFFDTQFEWIEMRLRAKHDFVVTLRDLNLQVSFRHNEEMRTEISAKFTRQRLEADFTASGLELVGWFPDANDLFALTIARKKR
jgi:L-histidine N-alpha-methyltransferase